MRKAVMVCDELDERQIEEELMRWFVRQLDELRVCVEDEAYTYDCNTAYDQLFYRLQADAEAYWADHYGYPLSPGQLTRAFFAAEYERSRRDRLAQRSWVARFSDFVTRKWKPA